MKKHRKLRMSMLSMFLAIAMFATYASGSTGAALTAYAEALQPGNEEVLQPESEEALQPGNEEALQLEDEEALQSEDTEELRAEAEEALQPESAEELSAKAEGALQPESTEKLSAKAEEALQPEAAEGTEGIRVEAAAALQSERAAEEGISLQFNQEYAAVGSPLTVTLSGLPEGAECKYQWKVGSSVKSTQDSYTPVQADLEKMLVVTATVSVSGSHTGTYQASMYLSKLPVLYVNTENGQAITSKEDYINGNFRIQGNEEYNAANTTLYDGAIEIRGRGNSTWANPKKPYKIKLDKKTDIFGFGKNKHWVLLANYTDESHMRNMLSYNLSGAMGMPYMQNVHVDLILNGKYQGTYQFCEQIKMADGRVNIHNWEDYASDVAKAIYKAESQNGLTKDDQDAIEEQLAEKDMGWLTTKKFTYQGKEYNILNYLADMPDATGGFLIELDAYFDEYSKFKTSQNQPLQFKNPEFIATNPTAMKYVQDYVNAFEKAIRASDYTTSYNGQDVTYSQLFDMASLTRFWLVSELFMNVDAMKKSSYLYKDIDGLFHMGPIWDMDWSSNSLVSRYEGSGTYDRWQTEYFSAEAQANQWYKSIIQDPYFAVQAYELYTQMREELASIIADGGKIDTCYNYLEESANANAAMWYGQNSQRAFATQVDVLKTYLKNRISWLDRQFQSPETLAASLGYKSAAGISVQAEDIKAQPSGTTAITAKATAANAKSIKFLINGKNQGTAELAAQEATIEVPTAELLPQPSYNTVQVFALDANGRVITSNSRKVTDYEKFYAEEPKDPPVDPDDPDKPVDPDNPDKPVDPDNPDKPVDPDNPDKPVDPDNPDKPVDPDNPDKPVDPDNPDKPVDPGNPDKPEPPTIKAPAVGKILTDTKTKAQYRVTKSALKGGTVEYYKNKNTKASTIKIPTTVTIGKITYKVTSIAEKAFKGNQKLKKITIGNNVTHIKKNSFSQCKALKVISLGKNITSIGDKAFYKCTSLTKIVLPSKVTKIGRQSFYGCKKLAKLLLPASIKSIGSKAFASAPVLKTVTIKTTRLNAKTIGTGAFQKIHSKAVIKVPSKKLKAYKSLLKKRGITNKKQKITKY